MFHSCSAYFSRTAKVGAAVHDIRLASRAHADIAASFHERDASARSTDVATKSVADARKDHACAIAKGIKGISIKLGGLAHDRNGAARHRCATACPTESAAKSSANRVVAPEELGRARRAERPLAICRRPFRSTFTRNISRQTGAT